MLLSTLMLDPARVDRGRQDILRPYPLERLGVRDTLYGSSFAVFSLLSVVKEKREEPDLTRFHI